MILLSFHAYRNPFAIILGTLIQLLMATPKIGVGVFSTPYNLSDMVKSHSDKPKVRDRRELKTLVVLKLFLMKNTFRKMLG